MATNTKPKPKVDDLLDLLENGPEAMASRGAAERTVARPNHDPNMGWFDIDLIWPMGTGELKLGLPGELDISNPRTDFNDAKQARLRKSLLGPRGQRYDVLLRAVKRNGQTVWELIDGERRWREFKRLRDEEVARTGCDPKKTRWSFIRGRVEQNQDQFDAFEDSLISDFEKEKYNLRDKAHAMVKYRANMQELVDAAYKQIQPSGANGKITAGDWNRAFNQWKNQKPWVLDILERARSNQENGKKMQYPTVTWDDVALRTGLTRDTLQDYEKFTQLPEDMQEALKDEHISAEEARALVTLRDDKRRQRRLYKEITEGEGIKEKDLRRRTMEIKHGSSKPKSGKKPAPIPVHPVLEKLNPALSEVATAYSRAKKQVKEMTPEERDAALKLAIKVRDHSVGLMALLQPEESGNA